MPAFTRAQMDSIDVGTMLQWSLTGEHYSAPRRVVEITMRSDIHGRMLVCGYTSHGDNASISFSIKEGDELDGKLYRIA